MGVLEEGLTVEQPEVNKERCFGVSGHSVTIDYLASKRVGAKFLLFGLGSHTGVTRCLQCGVVQQFFKLVDRDNQ